MARMRYQSIEITDHAVIAPASYSADEIAEEVLVEPDELSCSVASEALDLDVESTDVTFVDFELSPLGDRLLDEVDLNDDDDRVVRVVRVTWVFWIVAAVADETVPSAFSEALRWIPFYYAEIDEVDVIKSTSVTFSESINVA